MSIPESEKQSVSIYSHKVAAVVGALLGGAGREDDNNPLPPGPWDPVIRSALERSGVYHQFTPAQSGFRAQAELWSLVLATIAAKRPEIWDVIGGDGRLEKAGLNPQPLPPRYAFMQTLAETLIQRAELIQEVSGAMVNEGEQQGIIIVSGYVDRFVDEFCGNGFRLRFPIPGPRPKWYADEVSGVDLVIMAAAFDQAAKDTYNPEFGRVLAGASAKLAEAGLARF